jgi:hypothetical protein
MLIMLLVVVICLGVLYQRITSGRLLSLQPMYHGTRVTFPDLTLWSNGVTGVNRPDMRSCVVSKSAEKSQVIRTVSFAESFVQDEEKWEPFDAANPDYALVISDEGVLQQTEDEKRVVWKAGKGDPGKGTAMISKVSINAEPETPAAHRRIILGDVAPMCMSAFPKDGNNRLFSADGKFALEIELDGTVATWVLDGKGNHVGDPIWFSSKNGNTTKSVDHYLCMQPDGNLVVYHDPNPSGSKKVALWNTNTRGQKLALSVTAEGRAVIRNTLNEIVWFGDGSSPRTPDGISKGSIVHLPEPVCDIKLCMAKFGASINANENIDTLVTPVEECKHCPSIKGEKSGDTWQIQIEDAGIGGLSQAEAISTMHTDFCKKMNNSTIDICIPKKTAPAPPAPPAPPAIKHQSDAPIGSRIAFLMQSLKSDGTPEWYTKDQEEEHIAGLVKLGYDAEYTNYTTREAFFTEIRNLVSVPQDGKFHHRFIFIHAHGMNIDENTAVFQLFGGDDNSNVTTNDLRDNLYKVTPENCILMCVFWNCNNENLAHGFHHAESRVKENTDNIRNALQKRVYEVKYQEAVEKNLPLPPPPEYIVQSTQFSAARGGTKLYEDKNIVVITTSLPTESSWSLGNSTGLLGFLFSTYEAQKYQFLGPWIEFLQKWYEDAHPKRADGTINPEYLSNFSAQVSKPQLYWMSPYRIMEVWSTEKDRLGLVA